MSGPEARNLLQQLRQHTAAQHQALENTRLSRAILADLSPSDDTVIEFLLASYDCYGQLEPALAKGLGAAELKSKWNYTAELPAIADDLSALQVRKPVPATTCHTIRFERAYCVGGLYVLSGAQFGKRVIARHLQAQQHPLGTASRYFSSRSNSGGWTGFLAASSGENISANFVSLAKEGAADFFEVFLTRWQAAAG